jgi:hypothetical protein
MIPQYWLVLRADGTPDAYLLADSIESAWSKIPAGYTVRPLKVSDSTARLLKVNSRTYRLDKRIDPATQKINVAVYLTPENHSWYSRQPNKSAAINKLISEKMNEQR